MERTAVDFERERLTKSAVDAWFHASTALQFAVAAPFTFYIDGRAFECIAFLPHFGGERGTVVVGMAPQKIPTIPDIFKIAKLMGMHCSSVNLLEYAEYDEEKFKETLRDWGYFGTEELMPPWMAQERGTA